MELSHSFTVPIGIEETWAQFEDVASIAECFPGAQVSSADADSFTGSVKVKLGPIALVYNGSGSFVEKDQDAKRFVVDAKGKDKRGNGTAGAHVTVTMAEADGATAVSVQTDLAITGKPAQFGRGVMQDVSDKLLGQFVACLEQRFAPAPDVGVDESSPPESESEPEPGSGSGSEPAAGAPGPAPARATVDPSGALDLGTTVLPVLARAYWKPALGVVVALLVLRWLGRR